MSQFSFLFNSNTRNNSISVFVFYVMFIISQLGYIPALPYWLYNISTLITIPIYLLVILVYRNIKFTENEIIFLAIFIGSITLSTILSPYDFTISGFLRALVPIVYFYLVRTLNITKKNTYYDIISILLFTSFIVALYQILFQPIYKIEDGVWYIFAEGELIISKRPVSFLGNANVFGVFSVFCYIILFFDNPEYLNKKWKIIFTVLVIINIIVFAKSRTSLFAFFIVNLIYFFQKKKFKILFIILIVIVVFVIFIYLNYENYLFINELFRISALSETEDNSYTIRQRIAEFTIQVIKDRPLLGIGVGNEPLLMMDLNAPHKGSESASLLMLVERGLIGYLLYLSIIIFQFLFARDNITKFLFGFAIISVDFTETVCVLPQLTSFLAIYLAISTNEKYMNIKAIKYAV